MNRECKGEKEDERRTQRRGGNRIMCLTYPFHDRIDVHLKFTQSIGEDQIDIFSF